MLWGLQTWLELFGKVTTFDGNLRSGHQDCTVKQLSAHLFATCAKFSLDYFCYAACAFTVNLKPMGQFSASCDDSVLCLCLVGRIVFQCGRLYCSAMAIMWRRLCFQYYVSLVTIVILLTYCAGAVGILSCWMRCFVRLHFILSYFLTAVVHCVFRL